MSFKHFIPALAWGAIIFIAISLPPGNIPKTPLLKIPHFDKWVHFFLFLIFGAFTAYGFFKQRLGSFMKRKYVPLTLLAGLIYGSITELLQYFFFFGRNANIADVITNLFGTIIGVLLFRLALSFKPNFFY
jgi:VanZ family protein